MKYIIAKYETNYGPPVYRVRVRRRLLYSWVRDDGGEVLNFTTREDAHYHMSVLAQRNLPVPANNDACLRPSV